MDEEDEEEVNGNKKNCGWVKSGEEGVGRRLLLFLPLQCLIVAVD
jgi:hypothetical protein